MPAEDQVSDSIDHLFRQKAGQMVSILARKFGVSNIELIEDSVQDAMIAAMKTWPYSGVPANQAAWLIQTAKNRMIDQLRRSSKSDPLEDDFRSLNAESNDVRFTGELNEDQTRMMFACCHPEIPADSRVALTLKIVGGFSVGEIARAYLAKDEAIAKMLTRGKQKLRTLDLEIPAGAALSERLDSVLRVLYLMFNEGYSAHEGADLTRRDLCDEALRLAQILLDHPRTSLPKAHALASLFLFQGARLGTRTDYNGDLSLLADQDRTQWDKTMLAAALEHLRVAANGDEMTDYHIEAEIASIHGLAADFAATDWQRIIRCYDQLLMRNFSPVVALNRVVAIGEHRGPAEAFSELSGLASNYLMTSYNLYHLVRGHILERLGDIREAERSYQRGGELTKNESVRRFISRKIEVLTS